MADNDHDRAAGRREITDALIAALDRRHEVLDVIVDADNRGAAVEAVAALLGTTHLGAEAVVGMPMYRLTKDSRRRIAAELDDLNSRLTFTLIERPESSGEHLVLRPFSSRGRPRPLRSPGPPKSVPPATAPVDSQAVSTTRSARLSGGSTPRTPCGWSPK